LGYFLKMATMAFGVSGEIKSA
jgi:hypothetical protein